MRISLRFKFPCLIILLHQFLSFSHQKVDFIKVSVDNSCKIISYYFWSNRARTLLTSPFASKLLPLKAGRLSTLPQEHAFIPGQIRWFTGPSLPPFLFACSPHVTCYFSFLTLYRGNHFLVKLPIFWTKINRAFFLIAHRKKFPIFWCKPHLNWMIASPDISIYIWQKY